ncbi:hypothetical protein KKB18_03420, partial [bacterium]|nr:hypothetical protein [bacterium]
GQPLQYIVNNTILNASYYRSKLLCLPDLLILRCSFNHAGLLHFKGILFYILKLKGRLLDKRLDVEDNVFLIYKGVKVQGNPQLLER